MVWLFVTQPIALSATPPQVVLAAALSLGAVLVFMSGVKLVLSGGLRNPTVVLLVLAVAAVLAGALSLLLPAVHTATLTVNRHVSLYFTAHAGLLGAAALHPSSVEIWRRASWSGLDLSPRRTVLFMALAVVVPSALAFALVKRPMPLAPTPAGVGVPTGAAATMLLLLVGRLAMIAQVSRRRSAELARRSAALVQAAAEQEALQQQLAHRAMHDALTGLPNRIVLAERMEWALSREGGTANQALLLIDLDGFKDINDTFGHPVGDEVLADVSRRLRTTAPRDAVVARLGGDEFAIFVDVVRGHPEALAQAEEIIEAIRRPFVIDDQQMSLSTSIGLSIIGPEQRAMTPSDALRDADFALYAAKEAGKDGVVTFHPGLRVDRLKRAHITTGLRHALDHGDLLVHYQPVINLATGDIVGVEALARWRLPSGEMISPAQFIPVAEETGLINAIGVRILRQSCRDAHDWHKAYGVFVSVNVSGRQLDDPGFADRVITLLADNGLPGASLVLELTESSLIGTLSHQPVYIQLRRLRAHGVRIAIDDFGTGYSSLSYLSRLPADIVKLDKSFAQDRSDPTVSATGWAFTGAILEAIASLGLEVIAEGVETHEQAKALSSLKCPFAQGYLFSRPVPAGSVDDMLRALVTRRSPAMAWEPA